MVAPSRAPAHLREARRQPRSGARTALATSLALSLLPACVGTINNPRVLAEATPPVVTGFLPSSLNTDGREYDYKVYIPLGFTRKDKWPLIVFLHGMGESGIDNHLQTTVGLGSELRRVPKDWPFLVLFPQKPHAFEEWTLHFDAVLLMLEHVKLEHNVDPNRIYLTGISQGGHGAWKLAQRTPDTWAAVVPICGYPVAPEGGWTNARPGEIWELDASESVKSIALALKNTPVWAFHGGSDPVLPARMTTIVVDALREEGAEAELTIFDGVRHDSWLKAYRHSDLVPWLSSKRN